MICKRHMDNPVRIYHQCVGCELEWLHEELEQKQQEVNRLIGMKWISVEERLPKVAGDYLVYSIVGRGVGKWTKEGWKVWTTDAFDSMGWYQPDYPVTHWMPLPDPPEANQ